MRSEELWYRLSAMIFFGRGDLGSPAFILPPQFFRLPLRFRLPPRWIYNLFNNRKSSPTATVGDGVLDVPLGGIMLYLLYL